VTVDASARSWAAAEAKRRPELCRLGYFGSYARGDWGVGSDLDLVAVVNASERAFENRAAAFDLSRLPVPAELLVYTRSEWSDFARAGTRFARMLQRETVWLV